MKKTTREELFIEARFKCSNPQCVRAYPFHKLDVHHIHEQWDRGTDETENLIVLCSQCHNDLHYFGRLARSHLREWKSQHQADAVHQKIGVGAQQYLMFGLNLDKRKYRNLAIITKVRSYLTDQSGDAHTQSYLMHALAFALHRIGAAPLSLSILEDIVEDRINTLVPFACLPIEQQLRVRQTLCRALIQCGKLEYALQQISHLTSSAESFDIYEERLSVAEMYADALNVLWRGGDDAKYDETREKALLKINHRRLKQSKFLQTVHSQIHLYDGLFDRPSQTPASREHLIFDSLNVIGQNDSRGQSLRLCMLGIYYLRVSCLAASFSKRREHYIHEAHKTFVSSLRNIAFPNESWANIACCIGILFCYKLQGWEGQAPIMQVKSYAHNLANAVGLSYDLIREGLVGYWEQGVGDIG